MRKGPTVAATAAALLFSIASYPASAQSPTRALRWDPAVDVSLTVGGAVAWGASEILKGSLAPLECRWCDVGGLDARARDALVWGDPVSADTISDITGFVLMPLAAFGLDAAAALHEGANGNLAEDGLLIAEAGVAAADMTQLVKLLVGRERPFVHALPSDRKCLTAQPSDNNLSFFSGHTSEAFALAAASGTIATQRGYRWAPVVWGAGGVVAATTAYLRIAADKHWLTDVLVGAFVGAGIGFAVPYFFHSAVDDPPRASTVAAMRASAVTPLVAIPW